MMWDTSNWQIWYEALNKPSWTPDGEVISVIWTILYPIIFITYGYVFYKVYWTKKWKNFPGTPFFLNLFFNFMFTPLFFTLKNIPLATLDIILVWITILWTIQVVWKKSRIIALLQLPYLLWVSIASTIQITIFLTN